MSEKNTGGPAFGQVVELRCVRVDPTGAEQWEPALAQGGMTLRDYFAAKAMQALLPTVTEFPDEHWRVGVALDAYQMADAMLKAREA